MGPAGSPPLPLVLASGGRLGLASSLFRPPLPWGWGLGLGRPACPAAGLWVNTVFKSAGASADSGAETLVEEETFDALVAQGFVTTQTF